LDLSRTLPGALATQFLADGGAEVVLVEPPGGSPLRARADWPSLARGKQSLVLDLRADAGRDELRRRIAEADVLVTTFTPSTLRELDLTASELGEINARLVSVSITGWGQAGPWVDIKGYEHLVMAKLGLFSVKQRLATRPGPAFVSVPFASWGAAQSAVHGVLAALVEREASGRGQHVDVDLVRGLATLDTWAWFTEMIGIRWPGAYETGDAFNDEGELQGHLVYPLLITPTSDGYWLQFAQVEPRLFAALLAELDLTETLKDPRWKGLPILPTQELRTELWELMLQRASARSLAEWQRVFDTNPDISAEVFRTGDTALEHPQLLHDGRSVTVDDPQFGPVRQPSTLVHVDGKPVTPIRPAPALGERRRPAAAAAEAASKTAVTSVAEPAPTEAPLAGVTVIEFGTMFAAPFGATLLAELGARVIKIEELAGDPIRNILPFPEAGGAKVMQGKESIALDIGAEEGRRIVCELAARSNVVLQGFRAGAAERAGVDAATLCAVNPDLVYVNAPGYGTDGPFGRKPAYAPSIGAAAGLALTEAPDAASATGTIADIKRAAARLNTACAVPDVQADGIAALGVASTMLLGIVARARGRATGELTATMLATGGHAIQERIVSYPDRPTPPTVDPDGYGFSALYRLYETAQGWVFLAAPAEREWPALASALSSWARLDQDSRFATVAGRREHDAELAEALGAVFAARGAAEWEKDLLAASIACVEVYDKSPHHLLQVDPAAAAEYATTVTSITFDEHLRLGPTVRMSRSKSNIQGFCGAGEHTDALLAELGYGSEQIKDLRERGVIG